MKIPINSSCLFFFLLCAAHLNAEPFKIVSLDELDLNRDAKPLTQEVLEGRKYKDARFGFEWNSGDHSTNKWRPQGITGITGTKKKFLAISWYGRTWIKRLGVGGWPWGYSKRGARISFVDITDQNNIRYRHVLLVDEKGKSFPGLHAGGLAFHNGNLYVADSRKKPYKILVFPIDRIEKVPESRQTKDFFKYGYIMRMSNSFKVPIKPSFISLDSDSGQFVIGEYAQKYKKELCWFTPGQEDEIHTKPLYKKMQGVASHDDCVWIASSYGSDNNSTLYATNRESLGKPEEAKETDYPPGLEDIYLSKSTKSIWMLTEFEKERVVFETSISKLKP
jgi:hypothetical protein